MDRYAKSGAWWYSCSTIGVGLTLLGMIAGPLGLPIILGGVAVMTVGTIQALRHGWKDLPKKYRYGALGHQHDTKRSEAGKEARE